MTSPASIAHELSWSASKDVLRELKTSEEDYKKVFGVVYTAMRGVLVAHDRRSGQSSLMSRGIAEVLRKHQLHKEVVS